MLWLEVVGISKSRLKARIYIHHIYKDENCENYWQRVTGLTKSQFLSTIYKSTSWSEKKKEHYKGCCRIDVCDIDFYWQLRKWQELLLKHLNVGARSEADIIAGFGPAVGGSNPSGRATLNKDA